MGLGGQKAPLSFRSHLRSQAFGIEAASFMPGLFSGKQEQSAKDKFGHIIGFKV